MHTTTSVLSLATLPTEVILQIFSELPLSSVLRCLAVCRLFRDLISSSAPIRYAIELEAGGYTDGLSGSDSIPQRLARLQKHRKAWRDLSWTTTEYTYEEVFGNFDFSLYELVGGVFARGSRRQMSFIELPSSIRGTTGRKFSWQFDFELGDFAMDPRQDLLVLVERGIAATHYPFRIHLRALSTNMAHPLANFPILEEEVTRMYVEHSSYGFFIQIMGDTLGLLIHGYRLPSTFMVWQWTTGLARARMQLSPEHIPSTFAFLSYNTFVFPRFYDRPIPYQDENTRSQKSFALEVYAMRSDASGLVDPHRLATFLLPPVVPSIGVRDFRSRTDPAPVPLVSTSPGGDHFQQPFHAAPEDHVICFSIIATDDAERWACPAFFTRSSTLCGHAKYLSQNEESRCIPWEAWGPPNTRWIKRLNLGAYECFDYGNRFAQGLIWDILRQRCKRVRVLDFNPYVARAYRQDVGEQEVGPLAERGPPKELGTSDDEAGSTDNYEEESDEEEYQIDYRPDKSVESQSVTSTSVIRKGGIFAADVHSSLPYWEVTKVVPHQPFDGVMMDDERVICLTRQGKFWVHTVS
ncbi:hypothetical protein BOTBODRAFT_37110 [Botryobasidium botryosum FD-172 SS1]|uniref:F-box domain-containing protein n=1 Tax=Botryobasidium botryosum (strain FD-172 SS1) TaxID=930990 RepID=A0A067M3U6_BOTB1|nr:hypothetical protein BOTBODRAFT_37110 [Botryobasidium botryosum FD-172 SS1]